MGCIKNPKKFLGFIKYNGPHDYKIVRVGKFMKYVSDKFCVRWKCKRCGAEYENNFVSYNDLLHCGLSKKKIEEAKNTTF